jgi:hypothetical protein
MPSIAAPRPPESAALAERYGRGPKRSRRGRWFGVAAGGVVVVVAVVWALWAGLGSASAQIDAEDTGHQVIDARTVQISFTVSMPPGSTASCALQAQNENFAVVGWKIVDIPASDKTTQSVTETIRSSELANTGLIYGCWLT